MTERVSINLIQIGTGFLLCFATPASATDLIDQSQTQTTTLIANLNQTNLAQSFIPSRSNINGGGFYISSGISGTPTATIAVWDRIPNASGAVALGSANVTISTTGWADAYWNRVSLTAGTTYYLSIEITNAGNAIIGGTGFDSYANGIVYANSGYQSYPSLDYAFRTFYSPISTDNTILSVFESASHVRNQLVAREAVLTSALGYDSNEFGDRQISFSFVGRYTGLSDSTSEGAGALVAAYKIHPNVRLGAFVDYAPLRDAPTGIKHSDAQPTLGAFAVYEQNKDLTGLSTRVAAAYDYGRMTVTRDASLDNTEAGSGKAGMRSYAFSAEAGYGIRLAETVVAVPYLGIRYTDVTRKGYSEGETTDVTEPLTYNDYSQRLTTALGGVRFHGRFGEKVSAFVGLGAEFDVSRKMDAYSGTSGITDLETFSVATNSHPNRLRASASAGIGYQVALNQSISAQVSVRQQAYSADPSVTSMVKYSMGF